MDAYRNPRLSISHHTRSTQIQSPALKCCVTDYDVTYREIRQKVRHSTHIRCNNSQILVLKRNIPLVRNKGLNFRRLALCHLHVCGVKQRHLPVMQDCCHLIFCCLTLAVFLQHQWVKDLITPANEISLCSQKLRK